MSRLLPVIAVTNCVASATAWAQAPATVDPLQQPSAIDDSRIARDLDNVAKNKGTTTVWSFSDRSKATLDKPSAVPMFMPPEILGDLSGGSQKSANKLEDKSSEGDSRILNFDDEYFAIRQFDAFRMTVHGTRQKFAAAGSADANKSITTPARDYYDGFTSTEGGGVVNFGYAGADYVVEFECADGGPKCIPPELAERFVKDLVMCSASGRCVDNGTELIER